MEKIRINKIKEPICELYNPKDEFLGEISSTLELNDVRIQIKKLGISGYYILWGDITIRIDKFGYIETWPKGFYDMIENQLVTLIGWSDYDKMDK